MLLVFEACFSVATKLFCAVMGDIDEPRNNISLRRVRVRSFDEANQILSKIYCQ